MSFAAGIIVKATIILICEAAWVDVEDGAWQDAEFIRTFEDTGVPVRIQEGGAGAVTVEIQGTVLAADYADYAAKTVP